MSEQAQTNNTLVIALVVIAVLLAAIVGVIVYRQSAAVPPVSAVTPAADPAATDGATGAMGGAPAGMGGTSTTPTEVDPASATKVAEGSDPAAHVNGYYEACDKGDWETAFSMLPADKQAGNSPEALEAQVTGYGIESYTVSEAQTQGDSATVNAEQVTGSYGTFVNTWTFTKDGETWLVASKAVTGMK